MSMLRRAVVGLVAGLPIGIILYITIAMCNSAIGTIIIDPMVGLALGEATSVGLQFVRDLKEDEKK